MVKAAISPRLTLRMMSRRPLHTTGLATAATFLKLLISLVSNAALFTILYKAFMVLPATLNKTSGILLVSRSMYCAIGLSTEVRVVDTSPDFEFGRLAVP